MALAAFFSSFFTFGRVTVRMPFSTLAAMPCQRSLVGFPAKSSSCSLSLGFLPFVYDQHFPSRRQGGQEMRQVPASFVSLFPGYSTGSLPQFSVKNWVFQMNIPQIPCLPFPLKSAYWVRCKKFIPDGIQPIKKTAHEGQSKK